MSHVVNTLNKQHRLVARTEDTLVGVRVVLGSKLTSWLAHGLQRGWSLVSIRVEYLRLGSGPRVQGTHMRAAIARRPHHGRRLRPRRRAHGRRCADG